MFTANMQLYYRLEVHDIKTGRLIRRTRQYRARSFVTQYISHIRGFMRNANEIGVKDTGGTLEDLGTLDKTPAMEVEQNIAGVVTHGVRVGTGTTAVTMTDNKLDTEIAEGTGSGQMSHGVTVVSPTATGATEASFTAASTFSNNSGGTITVTETGIYCETRNPSNVLKHYMIVRDVLGASVAVTNGQVLTVTYTIKVTT